MFNVYTLIDLSKAILQTINMSFLLPPTDGISSHVSPLGLCIVLECVGSCDTVIYNKKYIFGVHPLSGTELLKPLEFPTAIIL